MREGVDVQVVRRLVEQQHVRLGHQQPRELQPPPLAAGELPDRRPLPRRREPEPLQHRRRRQLQLAEPHELRDGLGRLQHAHVACGRSTSSCVSCASCTVVPCTRRPRVERPLAGQRPQQRRLARAVHPDDPDPVARPEPPGHPVEQRRARRSGRSRPPAPAPCARAGSWRSRAARRCCAAAGRPRSAPRPPRSGTAASTCARAARGAARPAPCARGCGGGPRPRRTAGSARPGRRPSRRSRRGSSPRGRPRPPRSGCTRRRGTTGRASRPRPRSAGRSGAGPASRCPRRRGGSWARRARRGPGRRPASPPARPGASPRRTARRRCGPGRAARARRGRRAPAGRPPTRARRRSGPARRRAPAHPAGSTSPCARCARSQPADPADPAALRLPFAGEDVEQRGLAAAVEADDADPLAALDAERDGVEQHPGGVAGDVRGDRLQVDEVLAHDPPGHQACTGGRETGGGSFGSTSRAPGTGRAPPAPSGTPRRRRAGPRRRSRSRRPRTGTRRSGRSPRRSPPARRRRPRRAGSGAGPAPCSPPPPAGRCPGRARAGAGRRPRRPRAPARRAAPRAGPRRRPRSRSSSPYTAGVDSPPRCSAITQCCGCRDSTGTIVSPRPVPSAVPPCSANVDVAAQLGGHPGELVAGEVELPQRREADERAGGVRAAPGHAAGDRDALAQHHPDVRVAVGVLGDQLDGAPREVRAVRRHLAPRPRRAPRRPGARSPRPSPRRTGSRRGRPWTGRGSRRSAAVRRRDAG